MHGIYVVVENVAVPVEHNLGPAALALGLATRKAEGVQAHHFEQSRRHKAEHAFNCPTCCQTVAALAVPADDEDYAHLNERFGELVTQWDTPVQKRIGNV